ncbi:MAG: hypothetical protein HXY42_06725 [Chloroflexi bacterium]|nr:hypothetical protein [Chloroflexota bacterium]
MDQFTNSGGQTTKTVPALPDCGRQFYHHAASTISFEPGRFRNEGEEPRRYESHNIHRRIKGGNSGETMVFCLER